MIWARIQPLSFCPSPSMMSISVPPGVAPLNNSEEPSEAQCHPGAQHVSLLVLLCLFHLMGLFLNGFSLWVFTCRMSKWSAGTVLQFNLAVSDAIASPATPLLAVYLASESQWKFGSFACQLNIALLCAHFYGSVFFLMLISVHRYIAVVRFNRSSLMKRKDFVKKLCCGVWCFLLVLGLSFGFLLPVTTDDHKLCLSIHQKNRTEAYIAINFMLFILGFIVPLIVSLICYSCLATSVSHMNVSSPQGQSIKKKSLKMIGICLIIFGLCLLPLNVVRTVAVVVKKYYPKKCQLLLQLETAYYASYILGGINCCLDPFIYFFGSHNFRKAFRKSLRTTSVQKERDNGSESDCKKAVI
ncbi:cysteinyl leukotriene receptor 1-like [Electrophorus electricus]|uniref:cysteinyl leukotriene receptor 1-like n=1 Tax=Electrophorus electricus TaxID=8005 RepID=UPI0015CFB9F3|nr:cysteinyl leukotriene receptor 1-like [Electrophorus electricus]